MYSYYSDLSRNHLKRLSDPMTPGEMVRFLEEGARFRTFSEVLKTVYPGEDLTGRLREGLARITDTDEASVERKVRNWMQGSNVPQNREQLFQICFALGLDEEKADQLIVSADETGIHYRDPRELVYAFALRTGINYKEARELREKMIRIWKSARETPQETGEQTLRYTGQLQDEFAGVDSPELLEQFFRDFSHDLGKIHEAAYRKFVRLLEYLQDPDGGEEHYSLKRIMDDYLRLHVPNTRATGNFSFLQKVIKKNWPGESALLRMKKRSMDVERKTLLLLVLITEDFEFGRELEKKRDGQFFDLYYEDLLETPAEKLEERLSRMNLLLDYYGMRLLDPRSPFDCLLLYAFGAQYGEEKLSRKFEETLKILFGETDGPREQDPVKMR